MATTLSAVDLDMHCGLVAAELRRGRVNPFLGAGVGLCERPAGVDWRPGDQLPSAGELAAYLATTYHYPEQGHAPPELVRASQWVELALGDAPLFEELHAIFASGYEPNKLHRLLARLPAMLRASGASLPGQLVITTNYDDALERAFAEAGEPVDLVYYVAERNQAGRYVHVRPDGERVLIPRHTDYRAFALDERSVILKVHGAVNRSDEAADSYVITEDDYIDYLARDNASKLIPAHLMARMRTSHFLFLGYGLRDWNLRVILHHIWSEQTRRFTSWAIQRSPGEIDRRFWERKEVEILDVLLEDWVDAMHRQLR